MLYHYHHKETGRIYSFFFFLSSLAKRRTFFFFLLFSFFFSEALHAHWIYAPQADSTSHVWFRRAYISDGKPRQAIINVASTGYYKLYVNECNIGTALFYPLRHGNDSTPVSMTFDVTPYLRSDTNVVALIYSPVSPSFSHRQLSVNIYGIGANGKRFSHVSDNSWICRRANSRMTMDGGEEVDGTQHDPSWKAATIYNQAMWVPAEQYNDNAIGAMNPGLHRTVKTNKITTFANLHITQNPLLLNLTDSYWGVIRVTLREAKRGERLQIGNLSYICSGEIDEQAYPVFRLGSYSSVFITGDSRYRSTHVNAIELIETTEEDATNF